MLSKSRDLSVLPDIKLLKKSIWSFIFGFDGVTYFSETKSKPISNTVELWYAEIYAHMRVFVRI